MKKSSKFLTVLGAMAISGGAAVAPLAAFAQDPVESVITVNINENLAMTVTASSTAVTMANNALDESLVHTVNVATNNPYGYKLTLQDKDESNDLVRTTGTGERPVIPAAAGTLTATTAGWGFTVKTPGSTDYGNTYRKVPKSTETAETLHTNSGPITTSTFNEDTLVKFGIASGGVPSGQYQDTIVYTVTGNPAPTE